MRDTIKMRIQIFFLIVIVLLKPSNVVLNNDQRCPNPSIPVNGRLLDMPCRDVGCTISFGCTEGYWYRGSALRTCEKDLQWSGTPGHCEAVSCPVLTALPHGTISQPNRSYLATLTVTCDEGYTYSGPTTRRCQGDGTWSGREGACKKVRCPKVSEAENGILSGHDNSFMDRVSLQCYSGHILDGPSSVMCKANGNWSAPLGHCRKLPAESTDSSSTSLHPALIAAVCVILVIGLVVVGVVAARHYSKRNINISSIPDPNGVRVQLLNENELKCSSHLYCSFSFREDFKNEFSTLDTIEYRTFEALIRQGITEAIRREAGVEAGVAVSYLCQRNNTCFISIQSMQQLRERAISEALAKCVVTFENDTDSKYNVIQRSIVFREKPLHLILTDVHKRGHVKDKVQDRTIDLENQYIKLKLLSKDRLGVMRTGLSEMPDHYQHDLEENAGKDIQDEDLIQGGDYGKYILIRGRAGIGKSTLVQRLLWKWANGDWANKFKVILLLNLRYIMTKSKSVSLPHLLSLYSVYNTGDAAVNLSADWLLENQSQVGIILDGLDEIQAFRAHWQQRLDRHKRTAPEQEKVTDITSEADPMDWCFSLMNRTCLPEATVIVSSRPFADLGLIVSTIKSLKLGNSLMLIELMGLTRERVMEFIEKNVPKPRRDFVRQTMLNNPVLLSVSSITFYCAALCELLVEDDVVPEKFTTYTQITAHIMQMYMQRSLLRQSSSDQISQDTSHHLRWLSELALKGISSKGPKGFSRIVFHRDDFEGLAKEELEKVGNTGLLLQTEIPDPENQNENEVLSQFVHLSIQEFLAMVALLNREPQYASKVLTELFETDHFNMARLFVCGLAFSKDSNVVRKMVTAVGGTFQLNNEIIASLENVVQNVPDHLHALQIAHESQSVDIAKLVGQAKFQNEVMIEGYKMTIIDIIALIFMLRNNPSTHTVELKHVHLDLVSVTELANSLQGCTGVGTVKLFDSFDDERTIAFMEGIKTNTGIHTLNLISDDMTDRSAGDVAAALEVNKSVKCLSLDCNGLTNTGISTILRALGSSGILEHVSIFCTNMTEDELVDVAQRLMPKRTLVGLRLRCKEMTVKGVSAIARALQQQSMLTELSLRCNGRTLSDDGVKVIANAVASNTKLEKLELKSGGITDQGVEHLAGMLRSNHTLKELSLSGFQTLAQGAQAMLDTLTRYNTKVTVRMWPPKIEPDLRPGIQSQLTGNPRIVIV